MRAVFCILAITCLVQANAQKLIPVSPGLKKAFRPPVDSSLLIVINGEVKGTFREIGNPEKMVRIENILGVNVLNDSLASVRYGPLAKSGAVEVFTVEHVWPPDTEIELIVEKPEVEATFPGGTDAWRRYLELNANAAVASDSGAKDGVYTVMVQFIVDKEGVVTEVVPLTNKGYGMEKELMKLIFNGPNWIPAMYRGKKVNSYKKQPMTFVISSE